MRLFSLFALVLLGLGFLTAFLTPIQRIQAQNSQVQPTFVFLRDLRLGDSGEDVRQLQKILNTDSMTQVSITGNGSSGNETTYFGPATAAAVIRFQNTYADEVLRPAGMTQGSGFVGMWTRLKLNQILLKTKVGVPMPSSPAIPEDTTAAPTLSAISNYYGRAGSSVTLSGSGFSLNSNTVTLKGGKAGSSSSSASDGSKVEIKNVVSKNSIDITFTVPQTASAGRYDISVANNSSKKTSDTFPFMVTVSGSVLPVIQKIEPAVAKFDQTIKITGQNFTSTGNIVTSNLGVIGDLKSSDGKTLTFKIPLPDYLADSNSRSEEAWFGDNENLEWPVWIRVVNVNGVSDNPESSKFLINI